jgi:hypothetical protein
MHILYGDYLRDWVTGRVLIGHMTMLQAAWEM